MDTHTRENSKRYDRWLIVMAFLGGLSGWLVQGLTDEFVLWALPLFCLGTFLFILNGDNMIESLFILTILGAFFTFAWRTDVVVAKWGAGTIWGIYVALCASKIGFALGKSGVFDKR